MPFVYQQNINLDTRLGVWHIAENEDYFKDVNVQRTITHPHKRLQHLAGRHLLRSLFPDFPINLVKIAQTRKPFLENDPFHFSISHCQDYAAAIISTTSRVGVDIEVPADKILNLRQKFLNEEELLSPGPQGLCLEDHLTLCWSVKEAIFKWYGLGGVDFRQHIHIKSITMTEGLFICNCIFYKDFAELKVKAMRINNIWLTWLVT